MFFKPGDKRAPDMTATEQTDAAAWLDPVALIGAFPGPALVFDGRRDLAAANDAARGLGLAPIVQAVGEAVRAVLHDGQPRQDRQTIKGPDGVVALHFSLVALATKDGRQVLLLGRDATPERNLMKALLASRRLLQDLVACSADFAWETTADGRIVYVSEPGALGFSTWELHGRPSQELRAAEPPAELMTPADAVELWPFASATPIERAAVWLDRKDGTSGCYEISCQPFHDPVGRHGGVRGVARDITDIRRRDAELRDMHRRLGLQSRTDQLTGLLNRRAFDEEVTRRLKHLARHRRQGTLLYFDLDNFKAVNDVHGHHRGDAVLSALAERIAAGIRASDLAARLGGDEFAVWLEETDQNGAAAKVAMLRQIGVELDAAFGVAGKPLGLSIGAAHSMGGPADTLASLMKEADAAMYEAKRAKRPGPSRP